MVSVQYSTNADRLGIQNNSKKADAMCVSKYEPVLKQQSAVRAWNK